MATFGPYTAEEIAPPRVSFQRDGTASGVREFKTNSWADGREIARWLLPSSTVPTSGGVIVRAGASFPGIPELLVNSVEVEPFDDEYPDTADADGVATCPSGCKLTVSYSTLSTDEGQIPEGGDGQVSLSLEVEAGGDFLNVLPHSIDWASDGKQNQAEDLRAVQNIGGFKYTVTVDRCPLLPLAQWQSLVGKVNSAVMPYLGNAAAETVLFTGASGSKTLSIPSDDGTQGLWTLSLSFEQRLIFDGENVYGWQHIYRPRHGWDKPTLNDEYLYQSADLNALLIPVA